MKHQFRGRDRKKDMTMKEFKVSDYENSKERVDRIEKENRKAMLMNRFSESDKILQLRKDDKTLSDGRGIM